MSGALILGCAGPVLDAGEAAFFRDACTNFRHLLTRDRILVVEGALQEDEFNGGWSLRVKQAWDFQTECGRQARSLEIEVDAEQTQILDSLERTLDAFRPGDTRIRMHLLTRSARGSIDLDGPFSVRAEPALLSQLRALPGVESVRLLLRRPGATDGREAPAATQQRQFG